MFYFLDIIASEDETSLKRTPRRKPRNSFSTKKRPSIDAIRTPPLSPSEGSDEPPRFSPSSLRPPIFITRNNRGWGFTFKAIRVYIGDTSKYTMQHMVEVTNSFNQKIMFWHYIREISMFTFQYTYQLLNGIVFGFTRVE